MTVSLDRLIEMAGEHAECVLLKERHKQLTPIYLLFAPNDEVEVVACIWQNEIEKQLALLTVRQRAREIGAVALSFVTEAWIAMRSKDKPQWDLLPSQDPERREVVFACATDGKNRMHRHWQIVRNKPGGRIVSLVEMPTPGGTFEGRMIDGILPEATS